MLLGNRLGWRPFHDGLDFRLHVEPFHIVALQQADQLPQGHQVVKNDHLVLPPAYFLLSLNFRVYSYDIFGELFFKVRERFDCSFDGIEIFGVFGNILVNYLRYFVVVRGGSII